MAKRIYVSTKEASYFETHVMGYGPQSPKEGSYKVGDVIISSTQLNGYFGWVCVQGGSPGVWKVICDVDIIKADIEQNAIRIVELDVQIQAAKKLALLLQSTDNELRAEITKIIEANNSQDTKIKNILQDILDIDNYIDGNNVNIQGIQKDINDIKGVNETQNNILQNIKNNISEIEVDLSEVTKKAEATETALEILHKQVGENGAASKDAVDAIEKEIEDIKEVIGTNKAEGDETSSGIQKDIEDIKELIGINKEEGDEAASGLQKDIEELQTDLEEVKDLIGINKEEGDEAASGLQKDIEEIQNELDEIRDVIGTNKEEGDEAASGLQKDIEDIKSSITALEEKTSDTFASIDINSKDITSSGTLKDDVYASHGKCYSASSSTSDVVLYDATLSEVKFGHYAVCLRMRTNDNTTSEIVKLSIYNGDTVIATKNFTGSDFNGTDNYSLLYTTFEYTGVGPTKNNVEIKIDVLPVSNITIDFDYAYISMIIPAVFL